MGKKKETIVGVREKRKSQKFYFKSQMKEMINVTKNTSWGSGIVYHFLVNTKITHDRKTYQRAKIICERIFHIYFRCYDWKSNIQAQKLLFYIYNIKIAYCSSYCTTSKIFTKSILGTSAMTERTWHLKGKGTKNITLKKGLLKGLHKKHKIFVKFNTFLESNVEYLKKNIYISKRLDIAWRENLEN